MSTNGQQTASSTPTEQTLDDLDRVGLMGRAGQMADLLRTLDRQSAISKRDADYNERLREALAKRRFGDDWKDAASVPSGDDMNISIDSPTTVHNHYPAAQPAQSGSTTPATSATKAGLSTAAKLALAAAIAAGTGGAVSPWLAQLLNKPPAAVVQPAESGDAIEIPGWKVENGQ